MHISDSSSVHQQEFFTVHTEIGRCHTGLLTACEQDQDGLLTACEQNQDGLLTAWEQDQDGLLTACAQDQHRTLHNQNM